MSNLNIVGGGIFGKFFPFPGGICAETEKFQNGTRQVFR